MKNKEELEKMRDRCIAIGYDREATILQDTIMEIEGLEDELGKAKMVLKEKDADK